MHVDSTAFSSANLQDKNTISMLVENQSGVLARISGLFARRSYNIHSLTVSATQDTSISRMTVVVGGNQNQLQQIIHQLSKLVEVIHVINHTNDPVIERELTLVKMRATAENRSEIMQMAMVFGAQIASVSPKEKTMIVECFGEGGKIDAFLEGLSSFDILELVRSGKVALVRGASST